MSDREKKEQKELKIEDLPKTELTPEEMGGITGGISIGPTNPLPIPVLGLGTGTTPRLDVSTTNPGQADEDVD